MFISLQQLEQKPVRFQADVPVDDIEYDSNLTQTSELHAKGTATLISRALGEIRIQGELTVTMSAACDRCLEPAAIPVERKFDLVYVPAAETASGGEKEVDQGGIEVGYYEGPGLELNDVLREVVLLAIPMQLTCMEECKGICPVCGQNRNQGDCDCQPNAGDDRWSKLRSIRAEIGSRN